MCYRVESIANATACISLSSMSTSRRAASSVHCAGSLPQPSLRLKTTAQPTLHRPSMPSPLSRLSRTYERSFKKHPSLTLAITNGCLKCLGDFMAQLLPSFTSDQPFVFDIRRSLRFLLFGILHGPCVGKWHEFLEQRIPLTIPRGSTSITITPSEADQDLQLIETEKSLTPYRPVSIRSRSAPTIRTLTGNESHLSPLGSSRRNRSVRFWGLAKRLLLDQLIMAPLYTFLFISITGWFEGLTVLEIKERLHHLYWYILTANWKIWPIIQILNFNFMPLQYRVPWQGSCGVLWTVFLSLSTHSASHSGGHSNQTHSAVGGVASSMISSVFKSGSSNSSSQINHPTDQQNLTAGPFSDQIPSKGPADPADIKRKRIIP